MELYLYTPSTEFNIYSKIQSSIRFEAKFNILKVLHQVIASLCGKVNQKFTTDRFIHFIYLPAISKISQGDKS